MYITCTGKYSYPPGQHMYCPVLYYPARHFTAQQDWLVLHYYSCYAVQCYALSVPALTGYINKKNLRVSQSSTLRGTQWGV